MLKRRYSDYLDAYARTGQQLYKATGKAIRRLSYGSMFQGPRGSGYRASVPAATGAAAVAAATQAAIEHLSKKSKTQRRKKYVRKNITYSRSAGKLKTKTRVRRSKNLQYQMLQKGTQMNFERAGQVIGKECVYIGHSSFPIQSVRRQVWRAIIKRLMVNLGSTFTDFNQPLASTSGDNIVVTYITDPSSNAELNFSIAANGSTYDSAALAFDTHFAGIVGAQQIILRSLSYSPVATSINSYHRLDLMNSVMEIETKSALKVQNRSVTQADDEDANDVDNCPLYGKGYFGKGNGTDYLGPYQDTTPVPFYGDQRFGQIVKVLPDFNPLNPLVSLQGLQEPPDPTAFNLSKKYSKIKLDPGQIKTSVLRDRLTWKLNNLFMYLYINNGSAGTRPKTGKIGKFRFFGLEKMIDAVASSPRITVAFEIDLKINCMLVPRNNTQTMALFDKLIADTVAPV